MKPTQRLGIPLSELLLFFPISLSQTRKRVSWPMYLQHRCCCSDPRRNIFFQRLVTLKTKQLLLLRGHKRGWSVIVGWAIGHTAKRPRFRVSLLFFNWVEILVLTGRAKPLPPYHAYRLSNSFDYLFVILPYPFWMSSVGSYSFMSYPKTTARKDGHLSDGN